MQVVGILGGMGPAAGADFVRLFVQSCIERMQVLGLAVSDQHFPEHWLAQVPVPDRTRALEADAAWAQQPLEPMLQALGRLAALGARCVAMPCNTAHAWHSRLQDRFPQLDVLHIAEEMALNLAAHGVPAAALMATDGTYRSGVYEQALARAGVQCHLPTPAERARIMQGIYDGVKAGNMPLAQRCFGEVAQALAQRHGGAPLILGCTEIPLALDGAPQTAGLRLFNPAQVLAQALAQRAYAA
ncbi:aspartate racemase [Rhodoferax ferrireducens]|uniref:Aspartate racemase n=1 Tax=Rhodoferax ferrireducens TaxID=192843 RepID=A0ABU2C8T3_9BURK|nr:amino acid racemase [Rhodoferax ferrireducens]MDR7377751.1 aspartate racemase [Rhodoferax ferrireducens]